MELAADGAYCNDTITRGLPTNFVLFGAMRPDAVLIALPPARSRKPGRPSRRGRPVAKPEAIAKDRRRPWLSCQATLYGVRRAVRCKTVDAQWYRACGVGLLRIVIVRIDDGAIEMRVFFSTDPAIEVPVILETYVGRWAIEVCFRELKQLLGFGDSSARKRAAVERTAPFVGLVYATLVLWLPRASTAPASPPHPCGRGTTTTKGSASPTSSAPPSGPSCPSTFWIHVEVSATHVNPGGAPLGRAHRASGVPHNGETRVRLSV